MSEVIVQQGNAVSPFCYVDQNPPRGQLGVTLWGNNYQLKFADRSKCREKKTGLVVLQGVQGFEVSVNPHWPCATAVQVTNDGIGIIIHSPSIRKNLPSRGNLGSVVLGFQPLKQLSVWKNGGKLRYSMDLSVPSATGFNGGVAQIVAYLALRDSKSKQSVWFGVDLFDLRGPDMPTTEWDSGTNTMILKTSAGQASPLIDGTFAGSTFCKTPFPDTRNFQFVIGADQIRSISGVIAGTKGDTSFSSDPNDWLLESVNLNPEIVAPSILSYAQIGLTIRNWKIETL